MPIYEYECPQCKKVEEVFTLTRKAQPTHVECYDCVKTMKQKISSSSFKFGNKITKIRR